MSHSILDIQKLIMIIFYEYYNIMKANITFPRKPFRLEPLKKKHYKKADTIDKNEFPKKPLSFSSTKV